MQIMGQQSPGQASLTEEQRHFLLQQQQQAQLQQQLLTRQVLLQQQLLAQNTATAPQTSIQQVTQTSAMTSSVPAAVSIASEPFPSLDTGPPGDDLDLFGVGDMLDVELSLLGLCADGQEDDTQDLFSLSDLSS